MTVTSRSISVTVIQAVVPDYRIPFFVELQKTAKLKLISGDFYFTPSVFTTQTAKSLLPIIQSSNLYLFDRKILLQTWPSWFQDMFAKSIRVVELNPRCLTSWMSIATSLFLRRGKTYVWGHKDARAGGAGFLRLRSFLMLMSDGVIFYSRRDELRFKQTVAGKIRRSWTAPNSIVQSSDISVFEKQGVDFLYSGRLVSDKKPLFLISAFRSFLLCTNAESRLHIVGDGPLMQDCKNFANANHMADRIVFHGFISDHSSLKAIYEKCIAAISPGYGGLSITQSLSFGKPIIVSKDEPHAPEIDQFTDGVTGSFFETNSIPSLESTLNRFYRDKSAWHTAAPHIAESMRKNFSIEKMVESFVHGLSSDNTSD